VLEKATISDMHKNDQRLRTCLAACESVEAVLRDSGFEARLNQAQDLGRRSLASSLEAETEANLDSSCLMSEMPCETSETSAPEAVEAVGEIAEGASESQEPAREFQLDACEQHTLAACALENCAIELDRSCKVAEAIDKYDACALELKLAIETAIPAYAADHARLGKHREEVMQRRDYLKSLEQGSAPAIPVEEHIHPVQLDMCAEPSDDESANSMSPEQHRKAWNAALVAAGGVAAGVVVCSGGFLVLGTAAALGTAATVTSTTIMGGGLAGATAGAMGTGYAVTYHSHKVDSVSQRVGEAAVSTATKLRRAGTDMGLDKHAAKVEETGSFVKEKAKQGYSDMKAKIVEADLGTKVATTKSKLAEKAGNFIEKGAARSARIGDKLFDKLSGKNSTKTDSSSSTGGSLLSKAKNLRNSFVGSSSAIPEEEVVTEVAALHDIRIEVLSASDLAEPEYRLGDYASSVASKYLGNKTDNLAAVYVELQVGRKLMATSTAATTKTDSRGHCVQYSDERLLFPYRKEAEVQVFVRDKRSLQSVARGDPLVGEGKLVLELGDLLEKHQKTAQIPLMSSGQEAGMVTLRYQLLEAMGSSSSQQPAQMERLDSFLATDFQSVCSNSPPGSPRDDS
jgi:hypothetical protein